MVYFYLLLILVTIMPPQNQEPFERREPALSHSPWIVPFSIIIAGALIGAGIYLSNKNPGPSRLAENATGSGSVEEISVNPVVASDHILGNPNAAVVIIEFSDTECPFCKSFHQTMQRIMAEYGKDGNVAWVYRHFPIDGLHKLARAEAHATECAAELGGNDAFWEYTDLIYARTQSNDSLPPSELDRIALEIGLSQNDFTDCMQSNRYNDVINRDIADAQASGGRGTPHSILITKTGEKIAIKGAQPYDVMKSIVEAALEEVALNR